MIITEKLNAIRSYLIGNKGEYDNIEQVSAYILDHPNVRNFLVAPNSVVEMVCPLENNQAVMGMDLTGKDNKSRDGAIQAIETKDVVISGPYELSQGGTAISGRLAVYLENDGVEEYWGLISLTVDFPAVIEDAASSYLTASGYEFVLEHEKNPGEYITILESRNSEFKDFVSVDFNFKNMKYRFHAKPTKGWFDSKSLFLYILGLMFISIIIGIIAGVAFVTRYRLIEKASKDKLTGLYNREGGQREINERLKSGKHRYGAFFLMDLDHFKSVNYLFGHPKGDEVLIETAKILSVNCRSMDIVCRLGGDEFVVFFSFDGDSDFIQVKAEQIRKAMERLVFDETNTVEVSSSIGISFATQSSDTFEKLYKEADLALYASKENGRNQVTIFDKEQNKELGITQNNN